MKPNEPNAAIWAYPAMKKIFCVPGQKNKFSTLGKPLFEFIGVQLVHWHRQLSDFPSFSMNQMNSVVVAYCLGHEICFVPYSMAGAMNLAGCHFIGVH